MKSNQLICVVDDNPDYLLLFQHLFRSSFPDYNVRFFDSGKTFLSELHQMHPTPRLLLLDRHMPVPDGHQILVRVKQQHYSKMIPVVMMSADATEEEIKGCYEAGASSFVIKTIDVNRLRETLIALCRFWIEFNLLPENSLLR